MMRLLLLATEEGIPPTHIASTIVPIIGALIFCGSVYILLWSTYGAKKGALIYGTAFSAFAALMGIFWWFGAPGTPIATGLTYFPGQDSGRYQGKWYPMEPGSERADQFRVAGGDLDGFQTPAEFVGAEGQDAEELEQIPAYRTLIGDLSSALDRMLTAYLPAGGGGAPLIGAQRRDEMRQRLPDQPPAGKKPGSPFFSARAKPLDPDDPASDPTILVTEDRGLRVAGAPLQVVATYVSADPDAPPDPVEIVVEERAFYAFKDPGALWFPSAVWTGLWALVFAGSLFGLDRVEQREKARTPEREPVPA
ncbi:MAG TPA: hypothetical protein VHF25_03600 [Nitriliruptorales bacterium]|nr:hypothetical protein [Nitriliruptorales bacterium]